MSKAGATVHATAVLVGAKAILIRGPSGSGKSHLALRLLQSLSFARLIGDDRVHLQATHGRLLVRPAKELAGLLEVRGLGIRRLPFEALAVAGLILDLAAHTERMPAPAQTQIELSGVSLPRLGLPAEPDALPTVLAALGRPVSGN